MSSVDYALALQEAGFDRAFLVALRTAADGAGDHRMAELCARALDGDVEAVGACRRALDASQISRLETLALREQEGAECGADGKMVPGDDESSK